MIGLTSGAAGSILPMWSSWEIHRSEQEFARPRKKETLTFANGKRGRQ
jgi:hypothetical protein